MSRITELMVDNECLTPLLHYTGTPDRVDSRQRDVVQSEIGTDVTEFYRTTYIPHLAIQHQEEVSRRRREYVRVLCCPNRYPVLTPDDDSQTSTKVDVGIPMEQSSEISSDSRLSTSAALIGTIALALMGEDTDSDDVKADVGT
jgi:hypothetical protein